MQRQNRHILLGLILFLAAFPAVVLNVESISHYLDIMIFVGIYSLIAMGLSLLMGYAGQISLGHAAFFGIGAYSSGILNSSLSMSPWLAMAVGVLITATVAYVVGVPSLKLKGHYLAMATLGFGMIVSIFLNEEVELTGGPSGFSDISGLSIAGLSLDSELRYYILVWSIVLVILVFSLNIIDSRIGRALRSLHDSEVAADAMGIETARYKVAIFVLSAVYASIAGSLYTHYMGFLSPSSFDLFFSIKLVMMVVVGGMHSIWGALLGTWLLTFLGNEWLHVFQDFDILVYGAILLAIVMFLPEGLVGILGKVRSLLRLKKEART
ncbi:MAG: branched-chain amino acid ABC transporter permease [Deltaproteobacteria bacterium]|nr:branched-chain amino acid ABC transporter permease [Deltaproteobacteria bacterium]MBW2069898.1 branched-chain amino acid ABC transporter permease [Deltaproteobacteria bacterium]